MELKLKIFGSVLNTPWFVENSFTKEKRHLSNLSQRVILSTGKALLQDGLALCSILQP